MSHLRAWTVSLVRGGTSSALRRPARYAPRRCVENSATAAMTSAASIALVTHPSVEYDRIRTDLIEAGGIEPVRYWPKEVFDRYSK